VINPPTHLQALQEMENVMSAYIQAQETKYSTLEKKMDMVASHSR
jgi:hypothetical protein